MRWLFTFGFLLLAISSANGQEERDEDLPYWSQPGEDLSVGVVLSGGGAKGIAHIGALKVIEEAGIRVDYIAGTSIGSIIGALYAIGYSPDQMIEIARTTDWDELFSDRPDRQLLSMVEKEVHDRFIITLPIRERGIGFPSGLVAGQHIYGWLTRMTWPAHQVRDFDDLPIPFATVATRLETGEAVVFREGHLPDAIRASISFPTALTPHRVNGELLLDGGLARNLPVQEVLDMGADRVIAIDVSNELYPEEELRGLSDILNQSIHYRIIDKTEEQLAMADLVVDVEGVEQYGMTGFSEADEIYQLGLASTFGFTSELLDIASRQSGPSSRERWVHSRTNDPDPLRIDRIDVHGNEEVSSDVILSDIQYLEGSAVTPDQLELYIQELYSTRLFHLVTYRIERQEDLNVLQLHVVENRDHLFRAGARYETDTQASIYLHTFFRNPIQRGSNLGLHLRLGRDTRFRADYLVYGANSSIGLRTTLDYRREMVSYFDQGERLAQTTSHLYRAQIFAGTFLRPSVLAGIGFYRDFSGFNDTISPSLNPFSSADHHTLYGSFRIDTFNRRTWTSTGQQLLLRAKWSDSLFGSPIQLNQQTFYWSAWYAVHPQWSFNHSLLLGRTEGSHLPWSYWYSPNRLDPDLGWIRFGGFHRYEKSGPNIHLGSLALQFEPIRHRFLRAQVFAGDTPDEWDFRLDRAKVDLGFSLSAGAQTVLGPVQLILSGSRENAVLWELQVGYAF
ncbi:MAG: patatin-like phospholipase family protein [Bacteroidota bacterium]